MTEPKTSENKTSVVDDFFSALFANNSNSNNETSSNSVIDGSRNATVTPIPTNRSDIDVKLEPSTDIKLEATEASEERAVENDAQPQANEPANQQQAPPPVLDEFDEYSLLSSRRKSDNTAVNTNIRARPNTEQPAQTLAKRPIDWSKVIPESRMLIHQLPKSASKQELMDYFSKYGEVLEVVQKNTFGFVHFENPEQCARAVEAENYKTFGDVLLNLEICKRKPKFARVTENENRRRNQGYRNQHEADSPSPGRSRSRSRSRSRTRSPPPPRREPNKRRNSERETNKPMNDYRNRQRDNNSGFDYDRTNNYRPDYNRMNNEPNNSDDYVRENNYRPDYATRRNNNNRFNSNSAAGYNYSIVSRNGNEIPAVQIISWNNDHGLKNYTENLFAQKSIRTDTAILNSSNYSRDELVKQMVLEGVKAIVIIDGRNSNQGKVYLQVFAPVDHGDGVRYDEYDSVTPNDAVSIVQNTHPELRQRYQKRPKYNTPPVQSRRDPNHKSNAQFKNASQYAGLTLNRQSEPPYQPKPYYNPTRGYQYRSPPQPPRVQQPNYVTQSTYNQHPPLSASPNIDPNTLATIYNLIQSDTLSKIKAPEVSLPPSTSTAAPVSQPSIPQLLATLVSSLGSAALPNTSPAQPAPAPAPVASTSAAAAAAASSSSTSQQPSMAALLSTAAGGNPALAQLLLQQMTSGVTNPSSSHSNAQSSPSLVSQTNQPQQDYSYGSYNYQRN